MHKDLKFENIMLRRRLTRGSSPEEVHVMVIDMGLSELFGEQHGCSTRSSAACGTLVTMAPEVIAHDFSCKCDVWSVGCLMFAMLNSQPRRTQQVNGQLTIDQFPFAVQPSDDDPLGLHCLLANQSRGPDLMQLAGATREAVSAVKAMLSFEEVDRPAAFDCLRLPWFRSATERSSRRLSHAQVQVLVKRSKRELRTFSDMLVAKAASQLPSSRLASMEEQFKSIDVAGKGYITRGEIVHELHVLHVPRHEAERVADAMDLSRSGVINWSDFVASLLPAAEDLLIEGLVAFLSQHNFEDNGFVSALELGKAALETGCDQATSKFTAEVIMRELHHDGDDRLNLNDIKRLALGRESSGGCRSTMTNRRPVPQACYARSSSIRGRFPLA
jgi:serine/threonine protein kinase